MQYSVGKVSAKIKQKVKSFKISDVSAGTFEYNSTALVQYKMLGFRDFIWCSIISG